KGFSKSTWYHAIGITAERKRNKLELSKEKITYNKEQQFHQIDVMATTKESANAIKYRGIFKNGLTYWISAVVDKNYSGTDAFIENTFDSFRLVGPDTSNAVFSNKVDLFLSDAVSEDDNIRYSALQSIYMLRPEKDDLPKLSRFLSTFNYRPDEIESLTDLLEKIGHIQDPHVIPLLENQYKKANGNTIIQFAVLRALANNR